MRIYLETLGCRLNYSEMETLGRELADVGHSVVPSPDEADVCVLNTCAVTGEAARKSRQLARRLARHNPDARLAITGCYATLEPETVAALPNVSLVVENRRKDLLAELLQPWSAELNGQQWLRLEPEAPAQPAHRTRAFVKVQDGCNNHCTFCIVTVARGEERSRRVGDIVDEVRRLAAEGYQEAVLTGVHLGGYGSDMDTDLGGLVEAILRYTDLPRLRLSSLEPWDLDPEFFDLWRTSDGRLCPHLHLPLQAGCDRTLKRMARRTRTDDFCALVGAARERIPDLVITTDMIVGFPGESEADFADSLRFAEEMAFAHIHVFPYSGRAGTAAAGFGGQIPVPARRARAAAMETVARQTGDAVRQSFVGSTRPVLWETCERPANGSASVWSGLTDNYLRVRAAAPAGLDLENRITPTRLLSVHGDSLQGQVLVGL
ncbi:MAG: tRNA (N(6)-L-threonylcarbamoyladenosine(37)-C(2))-methylthiotransferase MtaB [Anaerolineae bacterium]|nr:tRNA (N(6)-L-threonylcarbamoyladenosine(37)-C(2))-methylthiotransferase MtaB [Anaerolineae bacterium]